MIYLPHSLLFHTLVHCQPCSYKRTKESYICKTLGNGRAFSLCRKEYSLTTQGQEAMIYIMNMAKRPIKKQDFCGRKITLASLQDTRHIPGKSDVPEHNSMHCSQSQNFCSIWLSACVWNMGLFFSHPTRVPFMFSTCMQPRSLRRKFYIWM